MFQKVGGGDGVLVKWKVIRQCPDFYPFLLRSKKYVKRCIFLCLGKDMLIP